jgi:hypothetical protein
VQAPSQRYGQSGQAPDPEGEPMSGARRLLYVMIVVLVSLAAGSSAALASPSARTLSPFCAKAVIYAKSNPGTNLQTLKPAALEANYKKFKSAESKMLSLAPSSIKPDLQKIFTFDNSLFAALQKAGWNFVKVPRATLESWAVKGPALKPASDKVISYFDKSCGLKYPLP